MRRASRPRPNLFVSLRLDHPPVVARLVAAQNLIVPAELQRDTISPAKFHITMALLAVDEASADQAARAQAALDALSFEAFAITLRGVATFKGGKVWFAKVDDGSDKLAALAARLRDALPADLLHTEDRAFTPHCTLWKSQRSAITTVARDGPHAHMDMGSCIVGALELVRMGSVDPHDGFYARVQPRLKLLSEMPSTAREALLDDIYALECEAFPPDEAATREKFLMRITHAPELFLVAFDAAGRVFGFVNGTAVAGAIGLTHDTMSTHDAAGDLVCIHGVAVAAAHRRRGWGARLVRYYVQAVARRQFALLCKAEKAKFYREDCGFTDDRGPSAVVHGRDTWLELRRSK